MDVPAAQRQLFEIFNEVAIIDQLANNVFNRSMPLGLSVSHFATINHLVRLGDGRTPAQLASAFQVTKPTMTSTLSRLSELGLIDIRPNPADGRSKLIFVTAKGRKFRADAIAALAPELSRMERELPVAELADMLPRLRLIRVFLDKNRPAAT
jgi:DNA-binding MarR family transcriptional regulator